MNIYKSANESFNLATIPNVIEIWVSIANGDMSIHLDCIPDNEEQIYNALPLWIKNELNVYQGTTHVVITTKLPTNP